MRTARQTERLRAKHEKASCEKRGKNWCKKRPLMLIHKTQLVFFLFLFCFVSNVHIFIYGNKLLSVPKTRLEKRIWNCTTPQVWAKDFSDPQRMFSLRHPQRLNRVNKQPQCHRAQRKTHDDFTIVTLPGQKTFFCFLFFWFYR